MAIAALASRLGRQALQGHIPSMPDDPAEPQTTPPKAEPQVPPKPAAKEQPVEIGGRKGPEPTRYGDWEVNGRCTDF